MGLITIIDYGLGNLGSVANMLKKVGAKFTISRSIKDIEIADKLILPGVGSFDKGINELKERGYYELIKSKVLDKEVPILGICLGMQLLTNNSDEGTKEGFGFIDAEAKKFVLDKSSKNKIPHMGWNTVKIINNDNLFKGIEGEQRFYFVHSYAIHCHNKKDIIGLTSYEYEFVSAFRRNNIYGVQFHPEKSHKFGMNLLKNFHHI